MISYHCTGYTRSKVSTNVLKISWESFSCQRRPRDAVPWVFCRGCFLKQGHRWGYFPCNVQKYVGASWQLLPVERTVRYSKTPGGRAESVHHHKNNTIIIGPVLGIPSKIPRWFPRNCGIKKHCMALALHQSFNFMYIIYLYIILLRCFKIVKQRPTALMPNTLHHRY
jgi:hypothetical protein